MPRGDHALLQRRGARGWITIARLNPGPSGDGRVLAPVETQGIQHYRLAVLHKTRVVAASSALDIYTYAPVTLARFTGTAPQTEDVNGQPFTYVVAIFQGQGSTGVASAPATSTVLAAPATTCRSVSLQLAAVSPVFGASGGELSATILDGGHIAATTDLSANQIGTISAVLRHSTWDLVASVLQLARIQNGQEKLDIAVNGSLSCYTPSGR